MEPKKSQIIKLSTSFLTSCRSSAADYFLTLFFCKGRYVSILRYFIVASSVFYIRTVRSVDHLYVAAGEFCENFAGFPV